MMNLESLPNESGLFQDPLSSFVWMTRQTWRRKDGRKRGKRLSHTTLLQALEWKGEWASYLNKESTFKVLFVYDENKDIVEERDGSEDDNDKDIAKDFEPIDFSKHLGFDKARFLNSSYSTCDRFFIRPCTGSLKNTIHANIKTRHLWF